MTTPGLGTRALTLSIDGHDYTNAVSNARVVSGESDSDFLTFANAAEGGARDYKLALTLVQDLASASLWRLIWDRSGATVPVVLRPNGGTTPSAAQPSVEFDAVIAEPDGDFLGGEANTSTSARFTTEVEWEIVTKPEITTA